jgi:hypothetical protein
MGAHSIHRTRAQHKSGAAIIVALLIVAMLITLVLAFFTTMERGRKRSKFSSNQLRARLIAEAAMEHAKGLLIESTKNSNYITACWNPNWSMPDKQRPIVQVFHTVTNGANFVTNLCSGLSDIATELSPDLNRNEMIAAKNQLTNAFRFKWIYLVNEGITNGRFAYWCDDESMKMNVKVSGTNIAMFGRDESEMGMMNLPGVSEASAREIVERRWEGMETLQVMRKWLSGATTEEVRDNFNQAKLYTTIYSRDSGRNYLGHEKFNINLITNYSDGAISGILSNLCPRVANKYSLPEWQKFSVHLKDYIDSDSNPSHTNVNYITSDGNFPGDVS